MIERRTADLDPWVFRRREAECQLERWSARQEAGELVVLRTVQFGRSEHLEEVDLLDAVVPEAVEDGRRVLRQQVARAGREGVRLTELGDVRPVPFRERVVAVRRRRGWIALDHQHVVAAVGESERGAEPTNTCPDDDDPGHPRPPVSKSSQQ